MKKVLNGLGVFGSIILTLILSILIFLYLTILNVKFVVSEKGMANTFKNLDVVEILKSSNDELWDETNNFRESFDLSEEEFEQILNSDKVKERVGYFIGEVLGTIFKEKDIVLTKENIDEFLNIAIDEYNKISEDKISDDKRKEIIDSFDEEMIVSINEEISSVNLIETAPKEYYGYVKLLDKLLFGNFTLIIFMLIIFIICLIVLLRYSYCKWILYVDTSIIISICLLIITGLLLLFVLTKNIDIIMPLRRIFAIKLFIAAVILFVLLISLNVLKKYFEKKDIVVDKNKIIIFLLGLILTLVIIFITFIINRRYSITFDTDGGI